MTGWCSAGPTTEVRDAAQRSAEEEGLSSSELAREALEEHIQRAS